MVWRASDAQEHPILNGIGAKEVAMGTTLYMCLPLNPKSKILMMGRWGDKKPQEPVAWTFTRADGGKSFYTSLGGEEDFEQETFQKLLKNGLLWAAGVESP